MVRSQPRSEISDARRSHVSKWGEVDCITSIRGWIHDDIEERKDGTVGNYYNPIVISDDDSDDECIGTVFPTYNSLSVDFAPDD